MPLERKHVQPKGLKCEAGYNKLSRLDFGFITYSFEATVKNWQLLITDEVVFIA